MSYVNMRCLHTLHYMLTLVMLTYQKTFTFCKADIDQLKHFINTQHTSTINICINIITNLNGNKILQNSKTNKMHGKACAQDVKLVSNMLQRV